MSWWEALILSVVIAVLVSAFNFAKDLIVEMMRKRKLERPRVIKNSESQEAERETVNPGFKVHVVTEEDEWADEQNR